MQGSTTSQCFNIITKKLAGISQSKYEQLKTSQPKIIWNYCIVLELAIGGGEWSYPAQVLGAPST